jgi:hypothetical protein
MYIDEVKKKEANGQKAALVSNALNHGLKLLWGGLGDCWRLRKSRPMETVSPKGYVLAQPRINPIHEYALCHSRI